MKTIFLAWTPFTGLGAYGGFRGNRWLRNRIKVFKQFVIPSMQNQTDKDFIHWVAWRPEEFTNRHVQELWAYMNALLGYRTVFTFGGLCMWDDKYPDDEARTKLAMALKRTLVQLRDKLSEMGDEVQVLLVPSDDLYDGKTIADMKAHFAEFPDIQAIGYTKGYICNYNTREILEYTPNTNPPFFAARFPSDIFFHESKHMAYISMKVDEGKYKAGTPYPSHEYIPNAFKMHFFERRGFMVGTHGENISTHFNHPFGGIPILPGVARSMKLAEFGILNSGNLKLPLSVRKWIIRRLPYRWQRKLRYILGERLFQRFYNFIRN